MNTFLQQPVTVVDLLLAILAFSLLRLFIVQLPNIRKLSQLHWLMREKIRIEQMINKPVTWRKNGWVGTVLPMNLPLEYYGFREGWKALMIVQFSDGEFSFCRELSPGDVRIALTTERYNVGPDNMFC
ncbi:MAG TPA: hypothetical protein VIT91_08115 [Chthoniobacterales bacterium]